MHNWGWMVCEKLKFKITVYFVTSVHKMIINIVSLKIKNNKHKDRGAFDLQNIKRATFKI